MAVKLTQKPMKKIRTLILSFLFSVLFAMPALAQEAFDIENFQTLIQIHPDSSLTVTETIAVEFTENRHGIFRDIQTKGISINVLGVTDGTGKKRQFQKQNFSEGVRLKIGDPNVYVSGKQTYEISYNVKKAIQFFPTHDELYWNATGNAWPVQIKQARTIVKLPESVRDSENLMFKCYTGEVYSSEQNCAYEYKSEGNEVVFTVNDVLPPYNGLTVVIGMPVNTLTRPATLEIKSNPKEAKVYLNDKLACETDCYLDTLTPGKYDIKLNKFGYKTPEIRSVWLIPGKPAIEFFDLETSFWYDLLVLLVFLLLIGIAVEPVYTFWRRGRDPEGRKTIVPQYEPPDKLTPAEMGTLVDEKVHTHDLTSTIIDLCVRGYLKIKVLPDAKGWIFKMDDYELIKLDKPKPGDPGLTKFEKDFMKAVFGEKENKKVSDLKNKFYKELPDLKMSLYTSLTKKGYFPKSPATIKSFYAVKGFILAWAGFIVLMAELGSSGTAYSAPLLINGVLSLIFAPFMPKKTRKGVLAQEHILGFKDYMETAEKHRLKFQEEEHLFYEFLPYAMTLKIADKWSKAFKDIFDKPPEWYEGVGTGKFHPIAFVHNINNVTIAMSTAFRSAPGGGGGGIGGGGGFSGGFSGGGFGGGGGGSW